jgi:hypothetical protein
MFVTELGDSALGPTVTALQIAHKYPDRFASAVLVELLKLSLNAIGTESGLVHNVPVHPLLEDLWDSQLGFSRRATGLLDCASPIAAN